MSKLKEQIGVYHKTPYTERITTFMLPLIGSDALALLIVLMNKYGYTVFKSDYKKQHFFLTNDEIIGFTGLSLHKIMGARTVLMDLGILMHKVQRNNGHKYNVYKINIEKLNEIQSNEIDKKVNQSDVDEVDPFVENTNSKSQLKKIELATQKNEVGYLKNSKSQLKKIELATQKNEVGYLKNESYNKNSNKNSNQITSKNTSLVETSKEVIDSTLNQCLKKDDGTPKRNKEQKLKKIRLEKTYGKELLKKVIEFYENYRKIKTGESKTFNDKSLFYFNDKDNLVEKTLYKIKLKTDKDFQRNKKYEKDVLKLKINEKDDGYTLQNYLDLMLCIPKGNSYHRDNGVYIFNLDCAKNKNSENSRLFCFMDDFGIPVGENESIFDDDYESPSKHKKIKEEKPVKKQKRIFNKKYECYEPHFIQPSKIEIDSMDEEAFNRILEYAFPEEPTLKTLKFHENEIKSLGGANLPENNPNIKKQLSNRSIPCARKYFGELFCLYSDVLGLRDTYEDKIALISFIFDIMEKQEKRYDAIHDSHKYDYLEKLQTLPIPMCIEVPKSKKKEMFRWKRNPDLEFTYLDYGIAKKYIEFIDDADWFKHKNKTVMDVDCKMFLNFVEEDSKLVGFNILTGEQI